MYFEKQKISESLENRDIELYTISSKAAFKAKKPVVFLSCRVHCGETPAQYMLQGVLDMLTDFSDAQTQILLDNYVFKIIPCLNPDGVSRGQWRFDTQGENLNRHYSTPTQELHPTVKAAKETIIREFNQSKNGVKLFMDFHAHSTKRGCFVYGNSGTGIDEEAEAKLLPKLMSYNSVNFDFRSSNFEDLKNNVVDGNGQSRASSSRAAINAEAQGSTPLIYTLEANYSRGRRINHLKPRFDIELGEKIDNDDVKLQDTLSELYGDVIEMVGMQQDLNDFASTSEFEEQITQLYRSKKSPAPDFTPEIWQDVGRSVLISLLDYDGINPVSRMVSSKTQELKNEVNVIRQKLKNKIRKRESKKEFEQYKQAQEELHEKELSDMHAVNYSGSLEQK